MLFKALKPAEKVGSLYLPEQAQQLTTEGTVVVLGAGAKREDGSLIPWDIKVGDKVVVTRYGGTEVNIDGEEFKVFKHNPEKPDESEIVGILE